MKEKNFGARNSNLQPLGIDKLYGIAPESRRLKRNTNIKYTKLAKKYNVTRFDDVLMDANQMSLPDCKNKSEMSF